MKVGISFVSTADASAEPRGRGSRLVAAPTSPRRPTSSWNALLGRIAVGGGTPAEQHTFYTALYHSLLFPNVVSDVNGDYAGSDGKVHTDHGREEYANFSEWDIYRSEIQLESLLAPHAVGDMVQSLVDDAEQGGWLPKWAIVGGDESQMNGDSADPIIADAYAMGVRNFDVTTALQSMVKGATQNETGHGLEIERQYLSQYLSQHYVNAGSLDLTSIDYSIGGSVTLEYAIDDFAIAQIAAAEHDASEAVDHGAARRELGVPLQPRHRLHPGPRHRRQLPARPGLRDVAARARRPDRLRGGQRGAVHVVRPPGPGRAGRRSWGAATPRDGKLETFFSSLNATRDAPYDWSGNEPSEWAPWEFDYFGAPEQTQRAVRAIVDTEYADAPGRRAGQRRPGRHLLVVRVGRPRPVPRDPGRGRTWRWPVRSSRP